jgi:hypothetical protein
VGGVARAGLARLAPGEAGDLVVDTAFDAGSDGPIHALAFGAVEGKDADVLYIGGRFSSLAGDIGHSNFAAVNPGTGAPIGDWASPDSTVMSIDVLPQADTDFPLVFVGGSFQNLGDVPKIHLGVLWGVGAGPDKEGTPLANWTPNPTAPVVELHATPATRDAANSKIGAAVYAGGGFGLVTYRFVKNLADDNLEGATFAGASQDPTFACGLGCAAGVRAITTSDDGSTLYVGGRFETLTPPGGTALPRRNLAAMRGVTDPFQVLAPAFSLRPWDPAPDGPVNALARSSVQAAPGSVYAGGDFKEVRGGGGFVSRVGLAALAASASSDANDAEALAWDPVATGGLRGGNVSAIAATPTAVYAGGTFTSANASPRANVAALDAAGGLVADWKPAANGPVHALVADSARLYLGGRFTEVDGAARTRLAAVSHGSGALDTGFQPAADSACSGSGCPAGVLTLALRDQTLHVGGSFETLAGAARANAGAVDAVTGQIRPWIPDPDGNVYSLLSTCGTVYLGGSFSNAGGKPRSRIAAVDPELGVATDWNPSAESGAVYTLARDVGTVYAGGSFARIGGTERRRIAALDAATGLATAWNVEFPGAGEVRALSVPAGGSVVYAGGQFTRAGGAERASLAALDRATGAALEWNPGADDTVRALLADDGSALVGGEFRALGATPQHGFGSFGIESATGGSGSVVCAAPEPPPEPVVEEPPPEEPPPPEPAPRPVARDSVAPQLAGARLTRRRFRTARRRAARAAARRPAPVGTTVRYRLSEPSVVRFAFTRRASTRCGKAARKRRCYLWRKAGSVGRLSPAGPSKLRFTGRVGRRWLRPGRYRVEISASDAARNSSAAVVLAFRVVRG